MAGRAGVKLPLERFNELSAKNAFLANVRPVGRQYLMEDFYYAGGLRALLSELGDLLHLNCKTVTGRPWGRTCKVRKSTTKTSSAREQSRSRLPAAWWCCAATWRRTAL